MPQGALCDAPSGWHCSNSERKPEPGMNAADPYRSLYAYPWDIAEIDETDFAEFVTGLGLSTVTLAASYHAGKFVRPHGRNRRVFFPEDGRAFFRTRPERYGAIRPLPAKLVAEDDVLGRLVRRADLKVEAWAVLLHNTPLGQQNPDAVVRNAFDDAYWYSLCPASPAAADYAVALCRDIADGYPVSGLVVETPGWMPYRHGYHHEAMFMEPNPGLEAGLALCFCSHCMRGAAAEGIDMPSLRTRVASHVDLLLGARQETPAAVGAGWFLHDMATDTDLAALIRWRMATVTRLVERIRAALPKGTTLHVIPSVQQPIGLCWIEGSDIAVLARVADGIEPCLYGPPQQAAAELAEIRHRAGASASIRAVLRPGFPDHLHEGSFTSAVHALAQAGLRDFAFYNYGHMRTTNLEWIGRALEGAGSKE